LHADYDASDKITAMNFLQQRSAEGEIVTGLLYVQSDPADLHELLNTVETPLNQLGEKELVPGAAALEKFNAMLR
jgi:2-oxoglutarate ferredoxin oxidoreductase subunit beta